MWDVKFLGYLNWRSCHGDRDHVDCRGGVRLLGLGNEGCKITGGELAINDEAAAFRWATEADITALATEAYAVRILDALNHTSVPAVRQHDGQRLL